MTHEYDEDLSQNPFFKTFLQQYLDLFNQCVQEKWLICVPRLDSLPNYTFTLEDFTHHILKPLNLSQELKSRSIGHRELREGCSGTTPIQTLSRDSSSSNLSSNASSCSSMISQDFSRKWNFRSLAEINVEFKDKMLWMDVNEMNVDTGNIGQFLSNTYGHSVSVLFDETFYTVDKLKYKVFCVSSPLNSQVESGIWNYNRIDEKSPAVWNLTSLRDCIDFLWINGRPKTLETFDAYVKLFLHNHRFLEDLPLPVQRDLVMALYNRCLSSALKSEWKHRRSGSDRRTSQGTISAENVGNNFNSNTSHSAQNFKLATETYIINGVYVQLMAAITSAMSYEDSVLNKVMRNVADIHPQDLGISNVHWECLSLGRQELGRLAIYQTPLAKLKCLRKTMKYLKHDTTDEIFEEDGGAICTDELLPIWVYLIVKTPIENWMAQLQFLRQFRFSASETPDNENSFLIVTLEASLLYLNSGKISGGLTETERDVGTPYQDYIGEFWLRSLFNSSDDGSLLSELFSIIRQGNLEKLENLIRDYDVERRRKMEEIKANSIQIDKLCHPLCTCPKCLVFSSSVQEKKLESIFEMRNEDGGLTIMHVAAIYGRPKIVDFSLSSGGSAQLQDNQGRLPLHYAASRGHQNALLLLLHHGCPINPTDFSHNTPLHLASLNGHESCVKALIYYAEHSKQFLDISAQNCNGDTCLHFASRYGYIGIAQLLVESGASIIVRNSRQRNPLDVAHDVHVTRILQKSLNRRSLLNGHHGEFVNVDMVKKDEGGGYVMLISDPVDPLPSLESPVEANSRGDLTFDLGVVSNSRRSSTCSTVLTSGTLTRKTSSVITPSFTPLLDCDINELFKEQRSNRRRRSAGEFGYSSEPDGMKSDDNLDMVFHISNVVPNVQLEPEHLRRVCVDNLEEAQHILARMNFIGVKRKREFEERELVKLFTAIENEDTPLALFYLGISTDELDTIDFSEDRRVPICHPLCPCQRCAAKSAGILCKLGLDLNAMSSEGFTPLHLAVLCHNLPLVKILLKYGADTSVRSGSGGKTPLEHAKEKYFEDIAVILQEWKEGTPQSPNHP